MRSMPHEQMTTQTKLRKHDAILTREGKIKMREDERCTLDPIMKLGHIWQTWIVSVILYSWWRHQMETLYALLAICAGNSPVPGEFPAQRPVTRRFDVFFDLHPNKRLSKQWWCWRFETPSCPLWRHRNVKTVPFWSLYCLYWLSERKKKPGKIDTPIYDTLM